MADAGSSCPDCGAEVGASFHFCPSCGIRLSSEPQASPGQEPPEISRAAPASAEPPTWRAERRLVCVLFVDLVGFTTLSERLDPEDVREIQSRYFEAARGTVARFGGTLEKFIGDAVMAVWGSPVAHENDAERAVRAAMEIISNVGAMRLVMTDAGRLAARAAVTTGEAAVSFDVDGEGMVTGDMVNTASRLQEAADPGTLLVDDATRRAVGEGVQFTASGDKALKGKALPVAAWLASETAVNDGSDSSAGHRGPFVGRNAELGALQQLVESVMAEQRTTLVSLTGVAGIGKSRLGRELERVMKSDAPLRWHRGRPPRWGEGTAFAPLAEIVRRMLGITKGESEEVVRRTVGAALARLIPDEAEREWIGPRLSSLLGVPTDLSTEREELFAAWRRYLEAEAETAPLGLVFEDLQWTDTDTFDFIEYLANWSHRRAILILTVARPELLERRPTWGAGIPQFRSMHLDRLDDRYIDELLHALAPDLPHDVAVRVRQRAEGVPLYAVEMARMVTEGAGRREGLPGAIVPESLHALLSARIDALPDAERSVLLMASVLGRRYQQDALATLSGLDRGELGSVIGTLIRREFLAVDDEPASLGRGQLAFVQDLMREVAYGTLSRRDRRRYHEAVIEQLSVAGEPQGIEPIAEHLVAAHAAAGSNPVEATAIARRATSALRQAADHAELQHAPHRALAHLERALSLAEEPVDRAEIAEAAALAARAAARFGVAEAHLRTAIDLRESLDDSAAALRDRAHLASVLLQAQRSDTALAELESAWEGYSVAGGRDQAAVHLAAELARAHMLRAETEAATEWARRAIDAAAGSPGEEGTRYAIDARISLGTALAQADRPEEGLAELREAMGLAAAAGLTPIELRARTNLAWLTASDDPRAALEIARRGVELARRVGSREWLLQLLDIAGILGVETGEWSWTLAQLDEISTPEMPTAYRLDFAATRFMIATYRGQEADHSSLDQPTTFEPDLDRHALGWSQLARALAFLVKGQPGEALPIAQSLAEETIGYERAEGLALAGRAATWAGDVAAADRALKMLAGEPGWGRAQKGRLDSLRASVAGLLHDDARAATAWDAALDTWRALDLPLREAICLIDRWVVLRVHADREAATALLERLEARGLVELLDSLG